MTALTDIAAINDGGRNTAAEVRTALTSTLKSFSHGEIYISSTSATSFADATNYVALAGTFALTSALSHEFDMNTNAQLRYTGTDTKIFHVACSFSFTSSANNQIVHWVVAKSGTPVTTSVLQNKIGTGTDVQSSAMHALVSMDTNDYLSIYVKNTTWTAAETITGTTANLFAMGMYSA